MLFTDVSDFVSLQMFVVRKLILVVLAIVTLMEFSPIMSLVQVTNFYTLNEKNSTNCNIWAVCRILLFNIEPSGHPFLLVGIVLER